jgi:N-methylhydantoinase B/oxoprolinase/acetone carboxylase alpha subunit
MRQFGTNCISINGKQTNENCIVNAIKPAHVVTSIKQSTVFKDYTFSSYRTFQKATITMRQFGTNCISINGKQTNEIIPSNKEIK